jgi:DNA polymerase-1
MSDRLVLIDGHALAFRAFHALPPFTSPKGELVNAVFGFANMLLKACRELRPRYLIATFDTSSNTFRRQAYEDYKGTRGPAPEGFRPQLEHVFRLLKAMNVPVFRLEGFEADDLLGTLSRQASDRGLDTVILTGDMDALQLVDKHVKVLTSRRGFSDTVLYDTEAVQARYGLSPEQIPDFKALRGDTSDNIPGVPGIGDKTAAKLLQAYGSVESVFEHLGDLPAKQSAQLSPYADQTQKAKYLATIVRDVPIALDLDAAELDKFDRGQVVAILHELGFRSLLDEVDRSLGGGTTANGAQPGLFDAPVETAAPTPSDGDRVLVGDADLDALVAAIRAAGGCSLTTVAVGDAPTRADLVGIAVAPTGGPGRYIPVGHVAAPNADPDSVRRRLASVLADSSIAIAAHNAKHHATILARFGIDLANLHFDPMIASYVLDSSGRAHGLRDLAWSRLQRELPTLQSVVGTGRSATTLDRADPDAVAALGLAEVEATASLVEPLSAEIDAAGQRNLFDTVEMPLVRVLARMERGGVAIDVPYLQGMSAELASRLDELERDVFASVGHEFKINSPQQLGTVLYDELHLPRSKKTRTGQASTGADVLEELKGAHPIVELVLEHRQLQKLKSTYVDALPLLVHPDTGRVHTSFNQTVAATGRLSSSDPNLQNIPIRTELGRRVRRAFVTGSSESCLLSADYSQIELRILAHVTQDPTLMDAFRQNLDIHAATAAEVNAVPIEKVDPDMRRFAKVVNFGLIYGMSEYGLSQQSGLPPETAAAFIRGYFERFPSVKVYQEGLLEQAAKDGYVSTLLGRRRYIPELKSPIYAVRQAGQRMAVNHPIQGSQADIIKLAMIEVHRELAAAGMRTMMILQVHDELVFEADRGELAAFAPRLREIMESAMELSIPVRVDMKVGDNWEEMRPL